MKTTYTIVALIRIAGLVALVQTMDYDDAVKMQTIDQATVAAAKKEAAHRKADRLREQGLLDDAKRLGYPLAHLPPEPQLEK